jgi:hypothetical protein
VPFSDPMADGPAIQAGGQRALKRGMTLHKTLSMVRTLRDEDQDTPYVVMGYYNPIYRYGAEAFARDAVAAGVDGGDRRRFAARGRRRARGAGAHGRARDRSLYSADQR